MKFCMNELLDVPLELLAQFTDIPALQKPLHKRSYVTTKCGWCVTWNLTVDKQEYKVLKLVAVATTLGATAEVTLHCLSAVDAARYSYILAGCVDCSQWISVSHVVNAFHEAFAYGSGLGHEARPTRMWG